ncbi:motility protein A [Isachenkonia alkalipeptolytica]|uniref:MotA/TolQ/ExbB proton channel domain-containing protein n=1 Tax=Isachenkonia alkalipeptolytica TaxID=2565777 RepID=A0AA43XN64_9CLOT|nr:MotA/TolQ/ExbB proton channel family protein [Isachenkonia alkalipeptolytica]NBG89632.1 hypothetical protein [Isachenkonia alkalipeptolytica]
MNLDKIKTMNDNFFYGQEEQRKKEKRIKSLVLLGLMLIVFQAMLGTISYQVLFNRQALQIIVAGILITMIVSFPLGILLETISRIKSSFQDTVDYEKTIYRIYQLAIDVKKNGALSVEKEIDQEKDEFMRDAITLLCDYKRPEAMETLLDQDIEARKLHLGKSKNVMKMVAQVSPALGLIGTLVGLIGLLGNLGEPTMIMTHMGSALISTLYGSLIANFIAVPLIARLREYSDRQLLRYNMIKEGILLIAKEDTARNVFDTMNVMLKEEDRLIYPRQQRAARDNIKEGLVYDQI